MAGRCVGGLLAVAYTRRITAEEQLRRHELPGCELYADTTSRFIPFIW